MRTAAHRRAELRRVPGLAVPAGPGLGRPDGELLVGRDLILRAAAFQIAFLTAAGVASRFGTAQIGAHQIGLQLWEFTALLLDAFAIAAQSLVGAALGGSDATAARTMAWQVARWGLYAGVVFAALFAAVPLMLSWGVRIGRNRSSAA